MAKRIIRLTKTLLKKYATSLTVFSCTWITATDEKVVRPAAKPGIKVRRISSDVVRRSAIKPATATPNILTKNKAFSSPSETVR